MIAVCTSQYFVIALVANHSSCLRTQEGFEAHCSTTELLPIAYKAFLRLKPVEAPTATALLDSTVKASNGTRSYRITVVTADQNFAGTDAKVWLILYAQALFALLLLVFLTGFRGCRHWLVFARPPSPNFVFLPSTSCAV